jgi:crotonobetainyl-CoA:carnitine CoA-transferase CaiB-like acyl-CoA transferase
LTTPAAVLEGVTVVEVGVFMAAPFATAQLADMGATVIKVEPPEAGDPVRAIGPFVDGDSSPFIRLNRNKLSVALDLKTENGRDAFLDLIAKADVLVENLRPGAMTRLGLGYDRLHERFPTLIYASASGWGQDGPRAPLPGLDIMAQARAGLMSITGQPGGPPVKVGVPICDLACALYIALAVTAALRHRDRTGEGQHVDVSLMEAGVSLAIWEAGRYFATGEVPEASGSAHQSTAPYQAVRVADGWVTIGAITPATWRGLCAALGLEALADEPRFADAGVRHTHRQELIDLLEAVTSTWNQDRLVEVLEAAGVPCAPIADYGEVFEDEHLMARGFFWDAPHRRGANVRQLGSPMRFSATPTVRGRSGPVLGEHTRQVLRSAGWDDARIDALCAEGAAADARP